MTSKLAIFIFMISLIYTTPALACQKLSSKTPGLQLKLLLNEKGKQTANSNLKYLAKPAGFCLSDKKPLADHFSKNSLATTFVPEQYIILVSEPLNSGFATIIPGLYLKKRN